MNKAHKRITWWLITGIYVAIIYATLGYALPIWNSINAFFGGKGVVVLYVLYGIVAIVALFYILFLKKERSIPKFLLFLFFIGAFLIMFKFEKNPGEKIHMIQYGVLGIFLYNALKIDFNRFDKRLYIFGSLISMILGSIDEVIQGVLPNRVFTWHDVFINGLSAIIALLLIRFNILKK